MLKNSANFRRPTRLSGLLCSLCAAVFLLSACDDDIAPDNSGPDEPQPIVMSGSSVDWICPPDQITIYGANFPSDPADLKLTIGGVEAEILDLRSTNFKTIIPWNIADATVELEQISSGQKTELSLALSDECDVVERPLIINSSLVLDFCPCNIIALTGENITKFEEYQFLLGQQLLIPYLDPESTQILCQFPEQTDAGILRVLDADSEEIYRSAEELRRNKYCFSDIRLEYSSLFANVRTIEYEFGRPDSLTYDSTATDGFGSRFRGYCFPANLTDGSQTVKREGNIVEYTQQREDVSGSPPSTRITNHTLRLIYSASGDVIEAIEHAYNLSVVYSPEPGLPREFTTRIRIAPLNFSGNVLELSATEIEELVTINFERHIQFRHHGSPDVIREQETVSQKVMTSPGSTLRIQLAPD